MTELWKRVTKLRLFQRFWLVVSNPRDKTTGLQDEAAGSYIEASGSHNVAAGPRDEISGSKAEVVEPQDESSQTGIKTWRSQYAASEVENESLRRSSGIERNHYSAPWAPGVWRRAVRAYESGWRRPPMPRRRVILRDEGPVKSAEQLQSILGIRELPPTTRSHRILLDDNDPNKPKGEPVRLSLIGATEYILLYDLTDGEELSVWYESKKRSAWDVYSLKEGIEREGLWAWTQLRAAGALRSTEGTEGSEGMEELRNSENSEILGIPEDMEKPGQADQPEGSKVTD